MDRHQSTYYQNWCSTWSSDPILYLDDMYCQKVRESRDFHSWSMRIDLYLAGVSERPGSRVSVSQSIFFDSGWVKNTLSFRILLRLCDTLTRPFSYVPAQPNLLTIKVNTSALDGITESNDDFLISVILIKRDTQVHLFKQSFFHPR